MSVAEAVPGADIPAGDLDGLCRAVWRRVGTEIQMHGRAEPWVWPVLNERLYQVRQGRTANGGAVFTQEAHVQLLERFEADLRGLLATGAERFAFCVRANATSVNGYSPAGEQMLRSAAEARSVAVQLPRVQPRELLARLASTGVIVQAVDGNLHVQPAEMLGEADRAALVSNKAAILVALAQPAAVL